MDVFCKIIKGDIPSFTLYEDEIIKVFLDANPNENGHALVVPKKHYNDLFDIDDKTIIHITKIAKKMDKLYKEKLNADGLTLVQNNGIAQDVKHFHLHLIPKYSYKQELVNIEDVFNQIMN